MSGESEIDLRRYTYSEEKRKVFFNEVIVPRVLLAPKGIEQGLERPTAVFVAGQPGAGKTATTNALMNHLSSRGGAARICGDDFKAELPYYQECLKRDPQTAGAYGRLDARALHGLAEQWAAQVKVNTVIETALTEPGGFEDPARNFRQAGFQVEVVVLGVHEALSRQGILARYQREVDLGGPGRVVTAENHDNCYRGMAETAGQIDEKRSAHVVRVWERGGQEVHANRLDANGQWENPARFQAALRESRAKPWSEKTTAQFVQVHTDLAGSMNVRWHPELEEVWRLGKPRFHLSYAESSSPAVTIAIQGARLSSPPSKKTQPPPSLRPDPGPQHRP